MKRTIATLLIGMGMLLPSAASAAVSDPLLQKLVDKGTLTASEAEELQAKRVEPPAALKGLSVGALVFLDYSSGQTGAAGSKANYSRFTVQRAYLNVVKEITPWMKARMTPDVKTSSTTTGDYTVRMKYAYAEFSTPDFSAATDTRLRAGLIQTPWLEFVESVNGYRMQGPMYQDKRGLQSSADLGVSFSGNFGGKLAADAVEATGSKGFTGRHGGFSAGAYNGGGYSSTSEANQDKSIQARVSWRPLPDAAPGLHLSYSGIAGSANKVDTATGKQQEWRNNTVMASYQTKRGAAYAEYYTGTGSNGGDATVALKKRGYSLFARCAAPFDEKAAVFLRFDSLRPDTSVEHNAIQTAIAGASYRLAGENYIVAAYEKTHTQVASGAKMQDDKKGQVVLQLSF